MFTAPGRLTGRVVQRLDVGARQSIAYQQIACAGKLAEGGAPESPQTLVKGMSLSNLQALSASVAAVISGKGAGPLGATAFADDEAASRRARTTQMSASRAFSFALETASTAEDVERATAQLCLSGEAYWASARRAARAMRYIDSGGDRRRGSPPPRTPAADRVGELIRSVVFPEPHVIRGARSSDFSAFDVSSALHQMALANVVPSAQQMRALDAIADATHLQAGHAPSRQGTDAARGLVETSFGFWRIAKEIGSPGVLLPAGESDRDALQQRLAALGARHARALWAYEHSAGHLHCDTINRMLDCALVPSPARLGDPRLVAYVREGDLHEGDASRDGLHSLARALDRLHRCMARSSVGNAWAPQPQHLLLLQALRDETGDAGFETLEAALRPTRGAQSPATFDMIAGLAVARARTVLSAPAPQVTDSHLVLLKTSLNAMRNAIAGTAKQRDRAPSAVFVPEPGRERGELTWRPVDARAYLTDAARHSMSCYTRLRDCDTPGVQASVGHLLTSLRAMDGPWEANNGSQRWRR